MRSFKKFFVDLVATAQSEMHEYISEYVLRWLHLVLVLSGS